jgi:hypothetical protein
LVLIAWDDTQIWLADLHFVFSPIAECFVLFRCCHRRLWVVLYSCDLVFLVLWFADLISLSSFKDRASELYRPHSEEKNHNHRGCQTVPTQSKTHWIQKWTHLQIANLPAIFFLLRSGRYCAKARSFTVRHIWKPKKASSHRWI